MLPLLQAGLQERQHASRLYQRPSKRHSLMHACKAAQHAVASWGKTGCLPAAEAAAAAAGDTA